MLVIGLMSGTSLDGVDAVVIEAADQQTPRLLAHHHQPYATELIARLRAVDATTALEHVLALDAELADEYAQAVEALLGKATLGREEIAAIGLHGQTVWHAPAANPPVTCQIGDPSRLAQATGITVVADFRQRDMAAGGEGAPFAPFFHALLFANETPRAVVNLGGIANVSLLDAGGAVMGGFDCGPGNILLDAWVRKTQNKAFDRGGQFAASGHVDEALLARLLDDPFFTRRPPKSTGPEAFHLGWLETHLTGTESPEDVQATLAALTAESLAQSLRQWGKKTDEVVLCGGGVNNEDLRQRIDKSLPEHRVITSDDLGWPAASIEAVGFACLALRTLQGEAVDLTAVTGARQPVILGGIYPA